MGSCEGAITTRSNRMKFRLGASIYQNSSSNLFLSSGLSKTSLAPISSPFGTDFSDFGRDPFNQNSNRSDREKRTTSKGGPVFSKLFRLDRTDPLSFGPKFPESLVEWIAPFIYHRSETRLSLGKLRDGPLEKLWGSGDFLSRRNLFFVIKFLV